MTNVALVGCAHIHTPGFVKRLQERPSINVKYVWDHDSERAAQNAAELNSVTVTDVNKIWNDSGVVAAIICSETDLHEDLVLAGAAAKKHLFVEKPLGIGTADAYKMADAIKEAGVLFQTGYFMRSIPYNLFLREQIEKGNFGQITRIRLSNCHGGSLGDWFTPRWLWMTDPKVAGVGAYGDLGTHVLDILLWILDGNVTRVTAVLDTALARYGEACDEYGEGLLQFDNKVLATIAAGWVDVADPVRIMVCGTEGQASVINNELFFKSEHVEGADGQTPWTDLPKAWPHAFELFLDAVIGAEPPTGLTAIPLVSPAEAARRSAIMEAMYMAAHKQTWVKPERP